MRACRHTAARRNAPDTIKIHVPGVKLLNVDLKVRRRDDVVTAVNKAKNEPLMPLSEAIVDEHPATRIERHHCESDGVTHAPFP